MKLVIWAVCVASVFVQGTAAELSKEYAANTVPGEDQIRSSGFVRFEGSGREGGLLVVGSSYAWHGPKPNELGWRGDWGMAASAREKDAVHLLWKAVKRVKPDAPLCIAQSACWERNYTGDVDMLERDFTAVKVFRPDWICIVTTVGNAQPDFAERHPIDRHYDVMVDWFRRLNPKAKVVLSVTDRIPAIGAAVRRYGKEHGFPVVDHGFLNEPNNGYRAYGLYEHPGVAWHPSDRGMAEMAARYARALGLKPEVDIDLLCPPRPETAAVFKEGAYPSAVKSYRETALAIYRYMTSLPAMTVLVETGKPNQKYQHNAYVSKTHAAHIEAMLDRAKLEPEKRETAMCYAKASAEYLLKELEPASAPLALWPPTYGRKPLEFDPKTDGPCKKPSMIGNEPEGAVKYRGEVMLLYPTSDTTGSTVWRRPHLRC